MFRLSSTAGVWAVVLTMGSLVPMARAEGQTAKGFGVCVPRSQRAHPSDIGCFIVTEHPVGSFGSTPVFWHVTRFGTHAQAVAAARALGDSATVVDAFGRAWLFAIAGQRWRAGAGTHVAAIGPLPVRQGISYAALYMEASMRPGMKSTVHRHSGVEAWYTIAGETCLETPRGKQIGRRDNAPVIVPGDLPMELTATGTATRRALVLILHDASLPPTAMEHGWKPKGLCR